MVNVGVCGVRACVCRFVCMCVCVVSQLLEQCRIVEWLNVRMCVCGGGLSVCICVYLVCVCLCVSGRLLEQRAWLHCECVCVCVYVCVHVCVSVYVCVFVSVPVCLRRSVWICLCLCVYERERKWGWSRLLKQRRTIEW